jgi:periplasmic protein TonB
MARTLALTAILTLAWRSSAVAQSAIRAPAPVDPLECRAREITGSGVVLATVDKKTGAVTGARMLKSTGNKLLDGSALEALSRWRFKPGTVSQVHIPINFTMTATR